MKKIHNVVLAILVSIFVFSACDDGTLSESRLKHSPKNVNQTEWIARYDGRFDDFEFLFEKDSFEILMAPKVDSVTNSRWILEDIRIDDTLPYTQTCDAALQITFFDIVEGKTYNAFVNHLIKQQDGGNVCYALPGWDPRTWSVIKCVSKNCENGCKRQENGCSPCPPVTSPQQPQPECTRTEESLLGTLIPIIAVILPFLLSDSSTQAQ